MGTASVFIETLSIRGNEDCCGRLPNEARLKNRKSRLKAESGGGVLEEGAASPLPTS